MFAPLRPTFRALAAPKTLTSGNVRINSTLFSLIRIFGCALDTAVRKKKNGRFFFTFRIFSETAALSLLPQRTFLHTTQTAPVRHPYLNLDALLKGKDFFILTTNQDTQFVKLYPEEKVAEIQGDHRFFQCAACCTDDTWDAVKPVADMVAAMGDGTKIPTDLIPRCPHCGGEAFPWVRGYGNFLQGKKYEEQYEKISRYVLEHKDSKILFLELGVGRMTPMFIQEPFWNMTLSFPHARYIAVNDKYDFLPKQLEDKGMTIVADIAQVLRDARNTMESGDNDQ